MKVSKVESIREILLSKDLDAVNLGLTVLFNGQINNPVSIFKTCMDQIFHNHQLSKIQFRYTEPTEVQTTSVFKSDKKKLKRAVTYRMRSKYGKKCTEEGVFYLPIAVISYVGAPSYHINDIEVVNFNNIKSIQLKTLAK